MSYEINELSSKAQEILKNETTKITYETWMRSLEIHKITKDSIVLLTTSSFNKDYIKNRYYDLLYNTFKFITNKDYKIEIISDEDIKKDNLQSEENTNNFSPTYNNSSLDSKYTFETFVVGNNNRFAHAASLAVAETPGSSYNPLFLYGGVGLGKTHLMYAIGNKILQNNPNSKVLYVTSEKFTNQLINSIKESKMVQFRNKYRNVDVLLIDDIQFISGKESVQEEFFNTFNTLRDNKKQIVISSDRPPKEITRLEERLRSRFEWGLIADLSNPDYETRLAILRKKANLDNIVIDDDILSNIADRISSNIRELEGVFNKIIVYSKLNKGPITIEMAEKAMNDVTTQNNNVISSDYIQEVVAKYFNINKKDLISSKRSNSIAYPRQIAMYLCRELANMSFPKIGEDFGNRDHTTVMHGCNKIEKEILENTNPNTKPIVESVKKIILEKK